MYRVVPVSFTAFGMMVYVETCSPHSLSLSLCRYIFTMLSPLARTIFHPSDNPQLNYLFEDNMRIEPEWYCPILPMVLVNGSEGIGTGYSTTIPNYNPREIVANIKRMMEGLEPADMVMVVSITS